MDALLGVGFRARAADVVPPSAETRKRPGDYDYDLHVVTLSTYSPDPSLFFRSQFDTRVPDGQGLGAFDDPAPHRAIDRAMAATGGAQEEAWAAVDTLLVTRGVVVPICWYESLLPYHRDLEGLTHLDGLGPSLAAAYVKS